MTRYKIDGYGEWEFYDLANFEGTPLFTATGPVDWTVVDSIYNDKVSSIRPTEGT